MTPSASKVLERCGTAAAGPHGRRTAERLLNAALEEFNEQGYAAASVDGIVKRAQVAHGTFYRYFGSKEQLFRALAQNALGDMAALGRQFPAVTAGGEGKRRLRDWVKLFCDTYAAHSAVLRNLSQAEVVGPELSAQGLRPLFAIAEAMAAGMAPAGLTDAGSAQRGSAEPPAEHAELTAIACLMMLERVNYLTSAQVRLTAADVTDRLADIVFAAFFPPPPPPPDPRRQAAEAARIRRVRHRRRQQVT